MRRRSWLFLLAFAATWSTPRGVEATGMTGPPEIRVHGADCREFAEIPGNGRLRASGESVAYTSPPGGPVTTHRGPLDFAYVKVQREGCVEPEVGRWKSTGKRCGGREVFVFSKRLVPGAVYYVGGRTLKVSAPSGVVPPQVCPTEKAAADPVPPPPPPPPATPVPFEIADTHLWGYEDPVTRAVVLPASFGVALPFTAGGIAAVADADGWRFIDRNGRTVVRPWIVDNYPDDFHEGLARFADAGRAVAFFDEAGAVVLRTRYPFVEPFSEGLAAACDGCRPVRDGEHVRYAGGTWGYIDRTGAIVVAFVYEAATRFEQGIARVKQGGRWFGIDRSGRERSEAPAVDR